MKHIFAMNITLIVIFTLQVHAETLVVTTDSDENILGTLRYYAQGSYDGDIIQIDSSVEAITINSQISITTAITIQGHSNLLLQRSAASGASRIFYIDASTGTVTFKNFEIYNGQDSSYQYAMVAITPVLIDNVDFYSLPTKKANFISTNADLTVKNSTFTNAISNIQGSAINFRPKKDDGISQTLRIEDTDFSNNVAGSSLHMPFGGAVYVGTMNDDDSENTVTIIRSSFDNNSALGDVSNPGKGGALYLDADYVTLTDTEITDNSSDYGGGIYIEGTGDLTMQGCTIQNNTAVTQGGGIFSSDEDMKLIFKEGTVRGNANTGLFLQNKFTEIRQSLVSHNTSSGLRLLRNSFQSLIIENSTFSRNETDGSGGALWIDNPDASVGIFFATIAANIADKDHNGDGSGGGICADDDTVSLTRTIVALNILGNANKNDLAGLFKSGLDGYNLIGVNDNNGFIHGGIKHNIVGSSAIPIDPILDSLGDYGGPTLTHALLEGSPAVNAAGDSMFLPPSTDQRGFPRKQNDYYDIGAFESDLTTNKDSSLPAVYHLLLN